MKMKNKGIDNIHRNGEGFALVYVLILMLIGSLVIPPVLSLMATGIKAGTVIEKQTDILYAADAGIEDAIFQIKHNEDGSNPRIPETCPTSEGDLVPYTIADIDGANTDVEITIWWIEWGEQYMAYEVLSTATATDGRQSSVFTRIGLLGSNLNVFSGALVSSGTIDLKNPNVNSPIDITGDVLCNGPLIPAYDPSNPYYSIDGDVVDNSDILVFPAESENIEFTNVFIEEAKSTNTIYNDTDRNDIADVSNYTLTIDSSRSFGPAFIFGNLRVTKNTVINLEGTIFVTGNIDFDLDSEINGTGSIVAIGNINFDKLGTYGELGETVIYSVDGWVNFKKEAVLSALIYVPHGDVTFAKNATIQGSVVCGGVVDVTDITSNGGFSVTYSDLYNNTFELPGFYETVLVEGWSLT